MKRHAILTTTERLKGKRRLPIRLLAIYEGIYSVTHVHTCHACSRVTLERLRKHSGQSEVQWRREKAGSPRRRRRRARCPSTMAASRLFSHGLGQTKATSVAPSVARAITARDDLRSTCFYRATRVLDAGTKQTDAFISSQRERSPRVPTTP